MELLKENGEDVGNSGEEVYVQLEARPPGAYRLRGMVSLP